MRDLRTPCALSEAFVPHATPLPAPRNYVSLWDTGATNSVINQRVVDDLGLKPIGVTQVHGVGGAMITETYMVSIELPNSIRLPAIKVTKGDLGTLDVLIGMDIITLGDFSVTNKDSNTIFSFRMPAFAETDYCEEQLVAAHHHNARLAREAANDAIKVAQAAKAAKKIAAREKQKT